MTNADKIRQMKNDELAKMIDTSGLEMFSCDECKKPKGVGRCDGPCVEWIEKWLDEECVDG